MMEDWLIVLVIRILLADVLCCQTHLVISVRPSYKQSEVFAISGKRLVDHYDERHSPAVLSSPCRTENDLSSYHNLPLPEWLKWLKPSSLEIHRNILRSQFGRRKLFDAEKMLSFFQAPVFRICCILLEGISTWWLLVVHGQFLNHDDWQSAWRSNLSRSRSPCWCLWCNVGGCQCTLITCSSNWIQSSIILELWWS